MRKGWDYKKLGECFPYIKNGANIKQIKDAKGYPITRIETLSGGLFNRDRMGYADIFDINRFQDYILEDGDLLMSHINSKAYIGRTVEYNSMNDEIIIHGMNLLRIKSNRNIILSPFFQFYTNSWHFKRNIARIRKDAVNQSSFAIADLKRIPIPVPPLAEQQSIVSELDKIHELISLKKAQLSDLDTLAQSIFYEMFGDPIENEKGWEVKKLGEIAAEKLSYGSGASAIEYDGETRYVRITDITDGGELDANVVSPNAFDNKYLLNDGDILFARSGATVGKTFLYKPKYGRCIYAGYLIRYVPDKKVVSPLYVFSFTKTNYYKSFISSSQRTVAQPNINAKQYGDLLIPLPPLPLQQSFARKIEAIEQQKTQIIATTKDLETLLASRMQYWFD